MQSQTHRTLELTTSGVSLMFHSHLREWGLVVSPRLGKAFESRSHERVHLRMHGRKLGLTCAHENGWMVHLARVERNQSERSDRKSDSGGASTCVGMAGTSHCRVRHMCAAAKSSSKACRSLRPATVSAQVSMLAPHLTCKRAYDLRLRARGACSCFLCCITSAGSRRALDQETERGL